MRERPANRAGDALRAALALSLLAVAPSVFTSTSAGGAEESPLMPLAPEDADTSRARTAVLAFVDYEDKADPGISPTELRLGTADAIASALRARGHEVLTHPEIDPTLRALGVRAPLDLPKELLAALSVDHDVAEVLLAKLVVYPDRIVLLGRALSRQSGDLRWADVVETREDAPIRWNELLRDAGNALVASRDARTDGAAETGSSAGVETLVVLPIRAYGVSGPGDEIATHTLLSALLDARRWRIPDPGLVGSALRSADEDPARLSAAGREKLASWFAPAGVLVPELLSYADTAPALPLVAIEEDGPTAAPMSTARIPLHLQALELDCRSGTVRSIHSVYLEPDATSGWFGFAKDAPLTSRFRAGSVEVARRMAATEAPKRAERQAATPGESS